MGLTLINVEENTTYRKHAPLDTHIHISPLPLEDKRCKYRADGEDNCSELRLGSSLSIASRLSVCCATFNPQHPAQTERLIADETKSLFCAVGVVLLGKHRGSIRNIRVWTWTCVKSIDMGKARKRTGSSCGQIGRRRENRIF
ncbi:hypothetical protein BDW60DRAFT_67405 [Aspergillus nidulans var. acristatus]|jgi:hypothetical protein